jgi:hypothetical protein
VAVIDRKDWEDHHCPGKETVHCCYGGLAREAIRKARADALEEVEQSINAIGEKYRVLFMDAKTDREDYVANGALVACADIFKAFCAIKDKPA